MDAEKLARLLAIREAQNNAARQKGRVVEEGQRPDLSPEVMEEMDLEDFADRQAYNVTGDEKYLPKQEASRGPASVENKWDEMSEEEARAALKRKMLEDYSGR